MTQVLLDTHAWVWSFTGDAQLSAPARSAIEAASTVFVSPISFFEIGQKVRHGKWPEMMPFVSNLPEILRDQGGIAAPLTHEICLHASLRTWEHRDPFDRLLASTAETLDIPFVTKDSVFEGLQVFRCVW